MSIVYSVQCLVIHHRNFCSRIVSRAGRTPDDPPRGMFRQKAPVPYEIWTPMLPFGAVIRDKPTNLTVWCRVWNIRMVQNFQIWMT